MILISHRGNISGKILDMENNPYYIDTAIFLGYDVEIDIWAIDNKIFLGHDIPQYEINLNWVDKRKDKLWIHCKNLYILEIFSIFSYELNYFWHETDTITLTSKGYIWAHTGKQPIKNSIAVLPGVDEDINYCIGICSDNINNFKHE